MTTLTLLSGPMDHMTTSATYLLSTSLVASSPTTTTTTTTTTGHKIAPKRQRQESTSSELSSPASFRSSKRSRSQGGAAPAVARRNERERNRVRQVNQGFQTLRQHVPNGAKSKKMSKVETLRSAVQYIKQLQQLLGSGDEDDENSVPSFDEQFRHLRPHYGGQSAAMTNSEYGDGMVALTGGTTVGFGGLTPASSPTPSLGSDASSPYDSLSPEDEELLDFTTWLS